MRQELRREASGAPDRVHFSHMRDRDGYDVDIVLEQGRGALAGVEVKAAESVSNSDFARLRKLRSASGSRFRAGVILYDGSAVIRQEENLYAVPIRFLWEV